MNLNSLKPPVGAVKLKKRLGRGESSGLGKTSGRGHKGQRARAGGYHKVGFEGGQMPLQRRIPKRGFFSFTRQTFAIVNVRDLSHFGAHTEVDDALLKKNGLVSRKASGIKILGDGELTVPLTVKAQRFSAIAKDKIEKAGGQTITI